MNDRKDGLALVSEVHRAALDSAVQFSYALDALEAVLLIEDLKEEGSGFEVGFNAALETVKETIVYELKKTQTNT